MTRPAHFLHPQTSGAINQIVEIQGPFLHADMAEQVEASEGRHAISRPLQRVVQMRMSEWLSKSSAVIDSI